MTQIVVAVICAVLSAVATYYTPLLLSAIQSEHRKHLSGDWLSTSYASTEKGWVKDTIEITISPISITLQNRQKPHGFDYEGTAKFVGNRHLVGDWKSKRQGATNSGPFSMTIEPQGRYFFGFYGGRDDDGSYRWHGWCLARNEKDLEIAKLRLIDSARIKEN